MVWATTEIERLQSEVQSQKSAQADEVELLQNRCGDLSLQLADTRTQLDEQQAIASSASAGIVALQSELIAERHELNEIKGVHAAEAADFQERFQQLEARYGDSQVMHY